MNKQFLILIVYLLISRAPHSHAQKASPFNRIHVSFSPQYFFNKSYVEHDPKGFRPFRPHNTFGYYYAVDFERVTRSGLTFNAGLHYGVQRHNVDVVRDLSGFDPDAKTSLNGFVFRTNISGKFHYLGPRLLIGYRKEIKKDWALAAKIGAARKAFINGALGPNHLPATVTYELDDKTQTRVEGFMAYQYILGDPYVNSPGRLFKNGITTWELYTGFEKRFTRKYFKSITVGFETSWGRFTKTEKGGQFIQGISRHNRSQTNQGDFSVDWYLNRSISAGLKIGVGLW